jgi:hypothetical protein
VLRVAALAATALVAAGCGSQAAAPPPPPTSSQTITDGAHGLAFDLPPEWHRATASLTPGLADPREVLSAGTFPLVYRPTACSHVPGSALADLGPRDAFVTIEERGSDPSSSWSDFPPRPAHFGPGLGGPSEAQACVPQGHFADHWFGFSDGGRHFHVLVAFGPSAPETVQGQAWALLDSLQIDPRVQPGWNSVG